MLYSPASGCGEGRPIEEQRRQHALPPPGRDHGAGDGLPRVQVPLAHHPAVADVDGLQQHLAHALPGRRQHEQDGRGRLLPGQLLHLLIYVIVS